MMKTITIILNWNNPDDTILVADEVLLNQKASVLIIDNNSSDNSLSIIKQHYKNSLPNIGWKLLSDFSITINENEPSVYLLSLDKNYGFAGGINKAIRKIKSDIFKYIWLLNNDAIPNANALALLEEHLGNNQNLAFAGSLIADYFDRTKVQCAGVTYYPILGISKLVLKNELINSISDSLIKQQKIDFQHGSSLLVATKYLPEIGLLDEDFFLYFEEQDWQYRAKKAGYGNELVAESIVFHKGSMSTENSKYLFFYYS